MSTTPHRSASRTREPPSRPTTPLRPTSRSSLRSSHRRSASQPYGATSPNSLAHSSTSTPLDNLEPGFAELSDSMADLEANLMHLQLMHESLARFSESFAAFLYGLNMNAFCVDFPEAPVHESFARERVRERAREAVERASLATSGRRGSGFNVAEGAEATFMTTDTSFVENPPSSKAPSKFATPAPSRVTRGGGGNSSMSSARGGGSSGTTGRTTRGGSTRGTRGGGIPRGVGRIARGGAR
ncbi:DASH complex subunit Dam1 [Phyllosticta citribraziliensis]|uniref:DASH complex subunit DAM1 n=1 Tax=Phyllosticta citribraziliensis TaxID=989973 RepID=A0ABR1L7J3_9PEZI